MLFSVCVCVISSAKEARNRKLHLGYFPDYGETFTYDRPKIKGL